MDAKESQVYIAIIIALIIIGSAICYFFFSILQQQKRVRRLERENADAHVQILEKDRKRIAADLHDELSPMLAGVLMWMKTFPMEDAAENETRLRAVNDLDGMSNRLRAISFDLMPSALKDKGLVNAVKQFINFISNGNIIKIGLTSEDDNIELDEKKIIHAYRIIQEIVHNTIKHAKATELSIILENEKDHVAIATRDNGAGFDYKQQLKDGKGLGLKSLLNRINLLKADFLMDSKPGKGTSITIRIPKYGKTLH
jgi:signal transduction histidine kinase